MAIGGAALRLGATLLYALEFCCAGIILGIYSYFMAVQADRDRNIATWQQAVEGISGVIVLYTIFAVILTCCLGGKAFFALLALVMNVLCMGGMIAIAVLTRDGASSCNGRVETPLGNGPASSKEGFAGNGNQYTYSASLGSICKMNTACFAVAIVGAFLFLLSIPLAIFLHRHHKKEKRYGPPPRTATSPAQVASSGSATSATAPFATLKSLPCLPQVALLLPPFLTTCAQATTPTTHWLATTAVMRIISTSAVDITLRLEVPTRIRLRPTTKLSVVKG